MKSIKVLAIIQVRMESSRLPEKAIAKVKNIPAILFMLKRLQKSKMIDKIVIASTLSKADDKLQKLISKKTNIDVFRGSKTNVLSRFLEIGKSYQSDIIVRLTGDCPLVDPEIVDTVISKLINTKSDYASNTLVRTFPDGLDVEAFKYKVLKQIGKQRANAKIKEHVTINISRMKIKDRNIKLCSVENDIDFSGMRWTLDEKQDLRFLNELMSGVSSTTSWKNLLSKVINNPYLQTINYSIPTNEGIKLSEKKSLAKRYKNSNKLFNKVLKNIPLASQTFSKSYMQWPKKAAPLFAKRAYDSYLVDEDGNHYIDYVLSLIPIITGYCDYEIDNAVIEQINKGNIYSLPSSLENELAEKIIKIIPSAEMVRYGKNGSDVTTAAVRLARAYTGKNLIAVAGYHGWHDWYIGSSSRNLGVPQEVKNLTKKFFFNDIDSLKKLFKKYPNKIAAVILEPAGLIKTDIHFLKSVRKITQQHNSVLIFDEIISGFRVNLGGAQKEYGVTPDLTCLGKSIANGYPLSVLTGKRKIMKLMDKIFFSSTFGGDTISIAASLATIKKIEKLNIVNETISYGKKLVSLINKNLNEKALNNYISISDIYWWPQIIVKVPSQKQRLFNSLFRQELLRRGIMAAGTLNLCYAHTKNNTLEITVKRFIEAAVFTVDYFNKKNPSKYLEGELIEDIFRVRN